MNTCGRPPGRFPSILHTLDDREGLTRGLFSLWRASGPTGMRFCQRGAFLPFLGLEGESICPSLGTPPNTRDKLTTTLFPECPRSFPPLFCLPFSFLFSLSFSSLSLSLCFVFSFPFFRKTEPPRPRYKWLTPSAMTVDERARERQLSPRTKAARHKHRGVKKGPRNFVSHLAYSR